MTPRPFNPATVQARLELMDGVLRDLGSLGEVTPERLRSEPIVRAAVERFLGQLVDLAVSINTHIASAFGDAPPQDYRDSFTAAARAGALDDALAQRLKPSAGLRNVLIHEYVDIDIEQVATAVPLALRDYRRYVEAVARFVLAHADGEDDRSGSAG